MQFMEERIATSVVFVSRKCSTMNTIFSSSALTENSATRKHFLSSLTLLRRAVSKSAMNRMAGSECDFNPSRAQPSQIIIHVRLLDEANVEQQEALGVIGVNLLHGAFYGRQPEKLISSLQENLAPGRIAVDVIKFCGSLFQNVDNQLMSLQLVSQGLTNAAMF